MGHNFSDKNGEVASVDINGSDYYQEKFDLNDHRYLYFNNRPLLYKRPMEHLQPFGNHDQCLHRKEQAQKFFEKEKEIAYTELGKCNEDYERLKYNVRNYLVEGSENLKKFRLMNTSMFIQMWHGKYAGKKDIKEKMDNRKFSGFNADFYKGCNEDIFQKDIPSGWRAFQLAFILLNLDGIFDDNNSNNKRN